MLSGFPPLRGPVSCSRSAGPVGWRGLPRCCPARHGGSAGGCSKLGRAWLYGAAGHGDVPPSGPGSAIAVAYLNLLGHAVGWPSPRGGAQA